ncbi:hypothetical protein [Paraburkholderia bryophila]|uniref:Uncharacterized protein n=1 Tax=Paraburkholderia bryophila TaxID=420952 RepID=A0A329C5E3_9BURK|nr:hypothetical protein [Paraburkholderia bryophila]RAS29759.1 hypothetical protein BX591_11034 [Paraburkholderia bryophila]
MNNSNTNPKKASDPDANIVNALLSYMHDCGFDESHLTPMFLALTLEYVYQPHPRFWRDFNVTILIDALSRHMPNWRTTAGMRRGGADRLFQKLERILAINSFDEANAEMLLALQVVERPETPSSAFAWIAAELAKRGATVHLEFAQPDDERCGEKALDVVYCLEQAKLGNAVERTGTIVAKAYRDAVMKRHSLREGSTRQAVSAADV